MSEKYIGGNFSSADIIPYLAGNSANQILTYFPEVIHKSFKSYFETGSDALAAIINQIKENTTKDIVLWFPDHYCYETIQRVQLKTSARKINNYALAKNIQPSNDKINVVILLHFNRYSILIKEDNSYLKKFRDVITIEDFVQSPFEINLFTADYAFNSLRKFINIEIAIAYSNKKYSLSNSESEYYTLKKKAESLKTDYFKTGDSKLEEQYLELFKQSEILLHHSKTQLAFEPEVARLDSINFTEIILCRKKNYFELKNLLIKFEQISILEGDYFFLMFKFTKRNELRKKLLKEGVFTPVHWNDSNTELSKEILSLPIDQRYNSVDMKKIITLLDTFFTS